MAKRPSTPEIDPKKELEEKLRQQREKLGEFSIDSNSPPPPEEQNIVQGTQSNSQSSNQEKLNNTPTNTDNLNQDTVISNTNNLDPFLLYIDNSRIENPANATEKDFAKVSDSLRNLKENNFNEIKLESQILTQKTVKPLIEELAKYTSKTTSVYLKSDQIDDESMQLISKQLMNMPSITSVHIAAHKMGDEGVI